MNSGIELIRLIAVILITFTHTRNELSGGFLYFIIEKLPTYGTAILSIVSGYLYITVSKDKDNLWLKKIKNLLVPYLIANVGILSLVLIFNFIFGYNPLNRLGYNWQLITDGIFAMNSVPINPPTYFIRDIFVVFSLIEFLFKRNYYALLVIVPLLIWGTLFLRLDVVLLFGLGCLYGKYRSYIPNQAILAALLASSVAFGVFAFDYLKFPLAMLLFSIIIDRDFRVGNTGRYSYLLHLYHSPIIVISFPIINRFIHIETLNIFAQIATAILCVYGLYLLSKKFKFLSILSGGR